MSYADRVVRLDDSRIRELLGKDLVSGSSQVELSADDDLATHDMVRAATRHDIFPLEPVEIPSWVRRTYDLYCGNQIYITFPIVMPVRNFFSLAISTVVGVLPTIPDTDRAAILDAFNAFDPNVHEDVDAYVLEHLERTGIPSDAFRLTHDYRFVWQTRTIVDTLHEALMQNFERDWRGLIPEMNGMDVNLSLYQRSDTFFADYEPLTSPNQINVPEGTSLAEKDRLVEDRATEDANKSDCNVVDPEKALIKEFPWVPDTRVNFKWGRSRIGKCKFHFWRIDQIQHKRQVYCLYATATFQQPEERFRRIINECLREATTAAILAVVLTDLSTAITMFMDTFYAELRKRIRETVKCMAASLYLVVEPRGDWYDA